MEMHAVYVYGEKEPIAIFQLEKDARKWLYKYIDENVASGYGIYTNIKAIEVNIKENK